MSPSCQSEFTENDFSLRVLASLVLLVGGVMQDTEEKTDLSSSITIHTVVLLCSVVLFIICFTCVSS